ncbi:Rid family detoxifying hydrolase [Spiroplasma floricola]|uniref:2-iminobutanoate/2-iminopropanoate deaminase n=1 Tax=Spiroplasma floricola 23-6 TaxID=1336749 RepID=A0A2K8SDZ4_9MOLU|nr:Rid family detoxifying hydrolase [Spiroplasma floricola]AUB31565.1 2-iminobutanoate/2-iminopropanoate deaminase [Spiroplasma floricola 23-6]
MKVINTLKAPKAIGPYSQAILTDDNFLYLSGQLGLNSETMQLEEGIELQTKIALDNINEILTEADFIKNNVIKVLIFLKDINNFAKVNEIYENFFKDHKPARSAIEVSNLPKNGLIEIEVIAKK